MSATRKILLHKLNGLNDVIDIVAHEAGPGGAPHRYDIIGQGEHIPNIGPRPFGVNLRFQNGPISKPEDYNGITNEALLAVLIDRMQGFQNGPFKCRENAIALTHLEEALMWLQKRTRDRMERGVEGALKP
jgi:hypothetical protein